jgi:hypothetical protein
MEWQPIETAPRHTPILVTDGKMIIVIERCGYVGNDYPGEVGFGGYEWDFDFIWKDLTHWMPLPELPNISKCRYCSA